MHASDTSQFNQPVQPPSAVRLNCAYYLTSAAGCAAILLVASSQTRETIDQEVKQILSSSYERARALLQKNRKQLDKIAQGLLEHETLTGEEVKKLMKGKKIRTEIAPGNKLPKVKQ